ncbi:MAG TPA: hypothetical protein VF157_00545 [Chloroflexota bacterium]
MSLLWYVLGIVVFSAIFAGGLITHLYVLVGIGIVILPAVAVWGIVSSGPGSPFNPYPHH